MISNSKIFIKGMVCDRCITVITTDLNDIGVMVSEIRLGEATLGIIPTMDKLAAIKSLLQKHGFELLEDKNQQLIDKIKAIVNTALATQAQTKNPAKFSGLISDALRKDYNTISVLFSTSEGITLEKYIISQRIQIVKEYLSSSNKSLTQISDELGYSSVSHLSRQLKSYTGYDANHFKKMRLQTQLN